MFERYYPNRYLSFLANAAMDTMSLCRYRLSIIHLLPALTFVELWVANSDCELGWAPVRIGKSNTIVKFFGLEVEFTRYTTGHSAVTIGYSPDRWFSCFDFVSWTVEHLSWIEPLPGGMHFTFAVVDKSDSERAALIFYLSNCGPEGCINNLRLFFRKFSAQLLYACCANWGCCCLDHRIFLFDVYYYNIYTKVKE